MFLITQSEVLLGDGLISAVSMESKVAIVPRIIIDKSYYDGIVEKYPELIKSQPDYEILINSGMPIKPDFKANDLHIIFHQILQNDFDNNLFLDYLEITWLHNSLYNFKRYNTDEIVAKHAYNIKQNINLFKNNKHVLQKYEWCRIYHNKFCEKHQEYKEYEI